MTTPLPLSISLITAVGVQLACQLFKVVLYSIRRRAPSFKYFFSAGGMPSAHSAMVSALSLSIGLWSGFDSEVFAVSCVLALIVIYDAIRLRGAVQHHAEALRTLSRLHPEAEIGDLNQMIGHTIGEIAAGIAAGAGAAALVYVVFSRSG